MTESALLKHFKKAARQSGSVDQFLNYFHHKGLTILNPIDTDVIAALYQTVRDTTFNGYLEDWASD